MTKIRLVAAMLAAAAGVAVVGSSHAHHSFAMFDASQHVLVEGEVTEWNYNNPHSWLHIQGLDKNGEMKTWSFEGAAIVHAARQGVNGTTFRKGEHVKVIASPLRDGRTAGAMCFVVKQDGSIAQPNDGICNAPAVIAEWQSKGWLENDKHLASHPAPQP